LKEGATKAATEIGNSAKGLWDKITLKFEQLTD